MSRSGHDLLALDVLLRVTYMHALINIVCCWRIGVFGNGGRCTEARVLRVLLGCRELKLNIATTDEPVVFS